MTKPFQPRAISKEVCSPKKAQKKKRHQGGLSLLEILVVLVILGILGTLVVSGWNGLSNDAQSAGSILRATFSQARTQAISTSRAVRVKITYPNTVVLETNTNCNATLGWTRVNINNLLPDRVVLSGSPSWQVCFKSRGDLNDAPPPQIVITDKKGRTKILTMYMTGSVEVL